MTKLTDLIPRGVRNYRTKLCPGSLKASSNAWNRVALGTLLFLVIDPTVAAHWPVVMTDLPVGLLSATAIVLATRAYREWIWTDFAACAFFSGTGPHCQALRAGGVVERGADWNVAGVPATGGASGRLKERALRLRDYFKYWSSHSSQTRYVSDWCTGSPGSCPAVGMAMNFTVTPLSFSAW